jgi:hypothetical protein
MPSPAVETNHEQVRPLRALFVFTTCSNTMEPTMTTFSSKSLVSAVAIAVAGIVGLNATSSHAGEFSSATVVKPKAGLSFPVGSKQAVGYFLAERGGCDLTLLVGEAGESASESSKGGSASRFSTLVAAGRTARMDTADGPSIEFFCSTGASFLTTRVIDRLAYSAPASR